MVKKIIFENGRIYYFQWLVTLALNKTILHVVVHHSSTSTYMPNFIEIKETFCGQMDVRISETYFSRSTQKSRPKNVNRNVVFLILNLA